MPPLNTQEICTLLDEYLDVEFTFYKNEQAAGVIAQLASVDQDYILSWVKRIASTNHQLAYQFITHAIPVLDELDRDSMEAWALQAMDAYDLNGLYPALEIIHNVDTFLHSSHKKEVGALFENEANVLLYFANGLSGRKLKIETAEQAFTDTETIYLPPALAQLNSRQENFDLYKSMVAMLWAQTRYGTFRIDLSSVCAGHEHPEKFLELFHCIETLRLEKCLARELPGLYRRMAAMKQTLNQDRLDASWQHICQLIEQNDFTVEDSVKLTEQHYGLLKPFTTLCYQGELNLEKLEAVKTARMAREKKQLKHMLQKILDDNNQNQFATSPDQPEFGINKIPEPDSPDGRQLALTLNEQPIIAPDNVQRTLQSILQDLGDIPPEYLIPAGGAEYDPNFLRDEEDDETDTAWNSTCQEDGAYVYNEWDFRRQHYRKNWCTVREKSISPIVNDFYAKTVKKYSGLIKHLRKTFEAMRDENLLLKRQPYGDEVDIDAYVEALADANDGSEMTDRLYTRQHRSERNIAVCFMVDMSGSTKGWINDAERESLILLSESLESLGDRYAIFGFSGMARKRCEIFTIKEFEDTYSEEVKGRITGIAPKDYTRMGFAIRHLTKKLLEIEARTRILITISDGKPDDYDNYRGEYGIEDTRRALIESRREGVHPYCITIDKQARDYLPHMYGAAAYTVIDEVAQLPMKVPDIYRRLTS